MSENEKSPQTPDEVVEALRAQGFEPDRTPTLAISFIVAFVVVLTAGTVVGGILVLQNRMAAQMRVKDGIYDKATITYRRKDTTLLEQGKKDKGTGRTLQLPIATAMKMVAQNPSYVTALPLPSKAAPRRVAPRPAARRTAARPQPRAREATQPATKAAVRPQAPAPRPAAPRQAAPTRREPAPAHREPAPARREPAPAPRHAAPVASKPAARAAVKATSAPVSRPATTNNK